MHEFITYDYIKPKYGFECFKKTSTFNEDFIKNYSNSSDTGYFLKVMLNIRTNQTNYTMIYHLYQEKIKLKKLINLQATCIIKQNVLCT